MQCARVPSRGAPEFSVIPYLLQMRRMPRGNLGSGSRTPGFTNELGFQKKIQQSSPSAPHPGDHPELRAKNHFHLRNLWRV
jgi:hypothetical protein